MNAREKLAAAVKSVAWGYIFMHLDFNLGTLNILPNWWGYCLILKALKTIGEEEKSAGLLRPFGILLALWEGALWCVKLLGAGWDGGVLAILASVVSLYFHFQLLTNLAAVSEKYRCPETSRILILRTVDTVMITLLALPVPWEELEMVMIGVLLVEVVVTIWICSVLFSLRRSLLEEQEPGNPVDNPPVIPL